MVEWCTKQGYTETPFPLRGLGALWPCSGVLRPPETPLWPPLDPPLRDGLRGGFLALEWTRPYVNNTDRERFEKEGSQWRYF